MIFVMMLNWPFNNIHVVVSLFSSDRIQTCVLNIGAGDHPFIYTFIIL